ncbi:unnamed protein product [Diamesa serratosioi]
MTDCSSSIHGSTTSSSDLNSHGGCGPTTRIRVIKLVRPHTNSGRSTLIGHPTLSSFGFSLRGGREFSTGFFVSNVVKGSEADLKDLRVGDQIIRVGGTSGSYRVDDAVHRELSQFIMNQDRLTLKVRGVGIIPVKEKATDLLTWHVVPLNTSKTFDHIDDITVRDVQIVLNVAPRTKLGCGICKGPEWKPGIFVQFTKENGIARESGLRPGDQILSCNGIDFGDIQFSEAVAIMKSSTVLELIVRTGVGMELFPGESSGYNSSASSVTGDQSPCWGDQAAKRLSIVREESTSSCDRMNGTFRPKSRDRQNLDRRKDKAVEMPQVPTAYLNAKNAKNNNGNNNTTIINLSENGTVINNTLIPNVRNMTTSEMKVKENNFRITNDDNIHMSYNNSNNDNDQDRDDRKIANICFVSKQNETKIVTVEVHRSATSGTTKAPPPPPPAMSHDRTPSVTSSIATSTLSSETFESSSNSSSGQSSLSSAISEELKRRAEKKLQNPSSPSPTSNDQAAKKGFGNSMGGQVHSALMDEFKKAHRKMFKNGFVETDHQKLHQQQNENEDEPDKISSMLNGTTTIRSLKPKHAPPPPPPPLTPAPDYDMPQSTLLRTKGTMGRIAMAEMAKASGNAAELESIESFKMTNPASPVPHPPPLYFSARSNGPPTMKKINRPVSVIVSEYGSNGTSKEPRKFDFINNANGDENGANEDMSMRLKNELEKTLSRSNLRRRSDSIQKMKDNNNNNNTISDNALMNQKNNLKKSETSTLNGILKNGTTKFNSNTIAIQNGHTKNISFGDIGK